MPRTSYTAAVDAGLLHSTARHLVHQAYTSPSATAVTTSATQLCCRLQQTEPAATTTHPQAMAAFLTPADTDAAAVATTAAVPTAPEPSASHWVPHNQITTQVNH